MKENKKPWIKTIDSVWTVFDNSLGTAIRNELTYTDVYWKNGPFGKKRKTYEVCMVKNLKDGLCFHTGFVPRIIKLLDEMEIDYSYETMIPPISYDEPHIKGITFREDQDKILDKAITSGRGVILSATGTGKSIILTALINSFSQENCLFLVHTQPLIEQIKGDLENAGITDYGEWTGKKKKKGRVMVATVQAFKNALKKPNNPWTYYFDAVFPDEAHHVNDTTGQYGFVMQNLAAPVKIGLTATLPETKKGLMNIEALLGPVIARFSLKDAIDQKVLAKPIIKIIKGFHPPITDLYDESDVPIPENRRRDPDYKPSKYAVVYWNGIVKNVNRNIEALAAAERRYKQRKSILINVIRHEHVNFLRELAEDYFPDMEVHFITGKNTGGEKEQVKADFITKKIKCLVATNVFNEGINVKSLDCCINAAGGKGEIATLQKLGRAIRKTASKSTMEYIDFEDKGVEYLHNHYKKRMRILKKEGLI